MSKIKVRCTNPYFKGTVDGVRFEQATGGAIGYATDEQAEKLADEKNFFIAREEAGDTLKSDGDAVAADSSDDNKTPETGEGSPTGDEGGEAVTSDLTVIKGIGKKTAAALASLGVKTLEDLADASTEDIAKEGITTAEQALDWRKQAAGLVADDALNDE